MAILITNIKTKFTQTEDEILAVALKKAKLSRSDVKEIHLYKKSLDARNHNNLLFISSVLIRMNIEEQAFCERVSNPSIQYKEESFPTLTHGTTPLSSRIVIAGFGPAGIFCAYLLAQHGYRPLVLERGYNVERRVEAVEDFWYRRKLNPACNVQFGEGGAGTFSDGKLTTRISDSRCEQVLQTLHQFGAPNEILTKAKPHIGTDRLRGVIKAMRMEIERLGGEVLFDQTLTKLHIKNNRLVGITSNESEIPCEQLVLAIGHSARDTFEMLFDSGVLLEPKGFSVGARIEHLQSQIDQGLYGNMAGHPSLPQGEYQLSYRQGNRGVYTFCMCPGGTVVPSSSSENTVVTNGMSEFNRDQKNANSALVVSVTPEDFGTHPLDGIKFQTNLESRAFQLAGSDYSAPVATVGDFLNNQVGFHPSSVTPSYALGVQACDFSSLLPKPVHEMMQTGLQQFNRKIRGFSAPDAVLTGVETRTSSPVRITRNDDYQSALVSGLYPCGEGAGYAGGIMSAAVDGLKIAEKLISTYAPSQIK